MTTLHRFYADENYPKRITLALQRLGYDVLTVQLDGRANQGIQDFDVLVRATQLDRCILTQDRNHYHHLHQNDPNHAGIVTNTPDRDTLSLVTRIDAAVAVYASLHGQLIRIVRPSTP